MNRRHPPPRVLIGVGFLMLLLTSVQGWGMVGLIAVDGESQQELLQELKRLHNLGLTGGFLAIAFVLHMIALALEPARVKTIYRVLLPSLLIAPIAFSDRIASVVLGPIPSVLQAACFALQALSALGITVGLVLMLVAVFRPTEETDQTS